MSHITTLTGSGNVFPSLASSFTVELRTFFRAASRVGAMEAM